MHKGIFFGLFFALTSLATAALAAPSFNARLEKGHALLKSGDVAGALSQYRDLQTEEPESPVLYYNLGRAHYEDGMHNIDLKANRDAIQSFTEAKNSFEKVLNDRDPELRKEAAFNHANSVAQIAMQSAAAQKYDETVNAFKQSVAEYEQFIRQYPDHAEAKKNLDHMRFQLKTMMQNPPKQDPNQQNQQGKDDKKGDQKKDDKQQQNGQDQKQDQQQAQKDNQNKDKDKDKQQDQQKEGKEQQAQMAKEDKDKDKDKAEDKDKADDKQNTDAILQSLDDIDKREQKENKNQQHGNLKVRSDWW